MKPHHTLLILVIIQQFAAAESVSKERIVEAEQVSFWERRLDESDDLNSSSVIEQLSLGLRNMGHRRKFADRDPSVDAVFYSIQRRLVGIPGHARYHANTVEGLRARMESFSPANRDSHEYDSYRLLAIAETLRHLPSPETISVLGNLLGDERDTLPKPMHIAENAHLAAFALSNIGLRDCPFEGVEEPFRLTYRPQWKQLPVFRAWWEEIKSGKRAFSFKGQAVEYRFKPDGTWATISIANPPDDGPKPVAAAAPVGIPVDSAPPATAGELDQNAYWVWIVMGMIGGLALVVWLGLRRFA